MGVAILAAVCSLAAMSAARGAGPQTAKIEAFLRACETNRRGAIAEFEHELRGLRSSGSQDAANLKRIQTLEANLASLRSGDQLVVPTLAFPPEQGAIGRLPRISCHVDRVLSGNEMLVRVYFPVKIATVKKFRRQGDTVMPAVIFLIQGVATAEFQEGADCELDAVLEVGQRQPHPTGGEAASVWILKRFDLEAAKQTHRRQSDQAH